MNEEKKGEMEVTVICRLVCGKCGKKGVIENSENSVHSPNLPYSREWLSGYNAPKGYKVICVECLNEMASKAPPPKYQPGYKFVCPDGVVGIVECVYEFGIMEENKRHYAYSCRKGDGIIAEDDMKPYKGNLKDSEITPLHPDSITGEATRGVIAALSREE